MIAHQAGQIPIIQVTIPQYVRFSHETAYVNERLH